MLIALMIWLIAIAWCHVLRVGGKPLPKKTGISPSHAQIGLQIQVVQSKGQLSVRYFLT